MSEALHNEKVFKWATDELNVLKKQIAKECIICDLIVEDKDEIIKHLYYGDDDEKAKDKYKTYRKAFRKENPTSKLTVKQINIRLSQITNLSVIFKSVYLNENSTMEMRDVAKESLDILNKIKNLYYTNIQSGYITNVNMNARLGNDYLEIILFVFVPASFITGYYGMNFTSMGNPGKNYDKGGLLTSKYGHYWAIFLIILLTAFSYTLVTNSFFSKDIKLVNTIKKLNTYYNLSVSEDGF